MYFLYQEALLALLKCTACFKILMSQSEDIGKVQASLTLGFTHRCFVLPHNKGTKPCYWQESSQIYPKVHEQMFGSRYYQKLQKWLLNNITFTASHLPSCNITANYQKSLVNPEKLQRATARKAKVPTLHSVSHL